MICFVLFAHIFCSCIHFLSSEFVDWSRYQWLNVVTLAHSLYYHKNAKRSILEKNDKYKSINRQKIREILKSIIGKFIIASLHSITVEKTLSTFYQTVRSYCLSKDCPIFCVWVIPYQISKKKSRPSWIFMKFVTDMDSTKKLSHTKIWLISL